MSYLKDLEELGSPSMDNYIKLAIQNLPAERKSAPWIGLRHGVALLQNDDELAQYLAAYGQIHQAKMKLALQSIVDAEQVFLNKINIIDWGCGQGLATVCFLDYLNGLGISPDIQSINLIEPSSVALDRAIKHIQKYSSDYEINALNEYINDVSSDDLVIKDGLTIHFFSNILDIESVDIESLSSLIKENIKNEQLFFCVGPQNSGATRINEFAQYFDLSESDLIRELNGRMASSRGTINLLVFRRSEEVTEIIKVAYEPRRHVNVASGTLMQKVLDDAKDKTTLAGKSLEFYRLVTELERMKSVDVKDSFLYPLVLANNENDNQERINIDIECNADFKKIFLNNFNKKITNWPKNLNIGLGIVWEGNFYRLLQYVYPSEDLKQIDITKQCVSVELSSFSVNPEVADQLNLSTELIGTIEALISDRKISFDKLESLLKDAISNDVVLKRNVFLALTSETAVLNQIYAELLALSNLDSTELLDSFLSGNLSQNHLGNIHPDEIINLVNADESQRLAIASALNSKLSVITGPPGTGKTQMILNLIANAVLRGQSVLVASKNNKAVDNVKDRYDYIDQKQYLLRFGSKQAIDNQLLPNLDKVLNNLPDFQYDDSQRKLLDSEFKQCCKGISDGHDILDRLSKYRDDLACSEENITLLTDEIDELKIQQAKKLEEFDGMNQIYASACSSTSLSWESIQRDIEECLDYVSQHSRGISGLIFKLFHQKKYISTVFDLCYPLPDSIKRQIESSCSHTEFGNIHSTSDLLEICQSISTVIDAVVKYKISRANKQKEFENLLLDKQSQLDREQKLCTVCKNNIATIEDSEQDIIDTIEGCKGRITAMSRDLYSLTVDSYFAQPHANSIISKYKNYLPDNIPFRSQDMETYYKCAEDFIHVFKLNSVTNLSVKKSYPLKGELFDLVIIDEASQCDIASALPLIYRAKQLVVIGDPLQLKHITSVNNEEERLIKGKLNSNENPFLRYADYSLWDYCNDLVTTTNYSNHPIILDSHYRCHPHIIGYSNEFFYRRKLGITLNIKTINRKPSVEPAGIIWEDVRGTQESESQNVNLKEADKCIELAVNLRETHPELSIGIITPFKHQVQEIARRLPEEYHGDIKVDTVHAFQGDERDVIIYSLVVTDNSPESKIRWIDYAVPNLVNVAVTRARNTLYVVGNREYICANSKWNLPLGYLARYTLRETPQETKESNNTYVIDTNVFINNPSIIDCINKNDAIVIPAKVIEELDYLKIDRTKNLKSKSEMALREINHQMNNRRIRVENADLNYLPIDYNKRHPDNMILSVALKYKNQNVILLTSDNGFLVKAKGFGIKTQTLNEFMN